MEDKKEVVKKPRGNPNISEAWAKSTGPKTWDGKIKSAISSPPIYRNMLRGDSKLLKKVRQCNFCPLRQKTDIRTINGKKHEITVPAQCPGYAKNKRKCIISPKDYLRKIKIYFDVLQEHTGIELQKALILQSIMDAEKNREYETLKDGRPKFYTERFAEQSLKYITELNKLVVGEKHRVEVEGEITEKKTLEINLTDDQMDKIANILVDSKTKYVDVEGEVVEDKEEE